MGGVVRRRERDAEGLEEVGMGRGVPFHADHRAWVAS